MLVALLALLVPLAPQQPQVSGPEVLLVGHVASVRGTLEAPGRFVADKIELEKATSDQVLIGTVPEGEDDPASFTLLGQPVVTDHTTQWQKLPRGSLAGKRVKIEGSWKGPRR